MIFKSFYIYYSNLARWRGRWDNSHWSRWQTLYPLAWPPSWEREPRAGGTSPPWAKPPWSTRPPWRRWRKHIWPPARDTMLMTRVYYLQVIYHGFFPFIIISCSLIAQFPDQLLYKITSIYCCVEVINPVIAQTTDNLHCASRFSYKLFICVFCPALLP